MNSLLSSSADAGIAAPRELFRPSIGGFRPPWPLSALRAVSNTAAPVCTVPGLVGTPGLAHIKYESHRREACIRQRRRRARWLDVPSVLRVRSVARLEEDTSELQSLMRSLV